MTRQLMTRATLAVALGLALASCALPQESAGPKQAAGQGDQWIWWKWANFVILAGGLGYLIGKNVPPLFQKQSSEIKSALRDAAKAKEEAAAYAAGIEARLANLQTEIEKLRMSAVPTDDMTPVYWGVKSGIHQKAGIDLDVGVSLFLKFLNRDEIDPQHVGPFHDTVPTSVDDVQEAIIVEPARTKRHDLRHFQYSRLRHHSGLDARFCKQEGAPVCDLLRQALGKDSRSLREKLGNRSGMLAG